MDKRTVASAHERIDGLSLDMVELKTETRLNFKELFVRVRRLEAILIAAAGTQFAMILMVLLKM
tara:strand:- start:1342 stop:1533 length:192 start_codon:yes stop_codon:yes gene_type:complete